MKTLLTFLLCILLFISCETPQQKKGKAEIDMFEKLVSTDSALACEVLRLTKENIDLQKQVRSLANNQALMVGNVEQIVMWIDRNSR